MYFLDLGQAHSSKYSDKEINRFQAANAELKNITCLNANSNFPVSHDLFSLRSRTTKKQKGYRLGYPEALKTTNSMSLRNYNYANIMLIMYD